MNEYLSISLATLVRISLAILACYRLSQMISVDNGPAHIFSNFRNFVGRKAGRGYRSYTSLAELVNCPYCLGVWISAIFTIFILYPNLILDVIFLWLGIAGAQTAMQNIYDKNEG